MTRLNFQWYQIRLGARTTKRPNFEAQLDASISIVGEGWDCATTRRMKQGGGKFSPVQNNILSDLIPVGPEPS